MKEKIKTIFMNIDLDIKEIYLLAIVANNRSEVVFYGKVGDRLYQSNEMIEEGIINVLSIDKIYSEVVSIIKRSSHFRMDKINVIKYEEKTPVQVDYYENNVSYNTIRKKWKKAIGIDQ